MLGTVREPAVADSTGCFLNQIDHILGTVHIASPETEFPIFSKNRLTKVRVGPGIVLSTYDHDRLIFAARYFDLEIRPRSDPTILAKDLCELADRD